MKKLFALLTIFAFMASCATAQLQPVPKAYTFLTAKITTTTYATFTALPPDVVSFQATVTKDSGTVGGYIFMECTANGTDWQNCTALGDSLTLANVSTAQTKIWLISNLTYGRNAYAYRIKIIPSGAGTRLIPTAHYLQRKTIVYNTN